MERSQYLNTIDLFMTSYLKNEISFASKMFADDIEIHFSTIGEFYGKYSVIKALELNSQYAIHTTTITNEMSYFENGRMIYAFIGHHLLADEKDSELYPVCFGGKYIFIFEKDKIIEICYEQEYQVENTIYLKSWHLASHYSDLQYVQKFKLDKFLNQTTNETHYIKNLVNAFFWALDIQDMQFIFDIVTDDIYLERQKTMAYGQIIAISKDNIKKFIIQNKEYYSMDQYSIKINEIIKSQDFYIVKGSHLVPQRLGTKKLNVHTKYVSFFDEDFELKISCKNNEYMIKSVIFRKMIDMYMNSIDIIRY